MGDTAAVGVGEVAAAAVAAVVAAAAAVVEAGYQLVQLVQGLLCPPAREGVELGKLHMLTVVSQPRDKQPVEGPS